MAKTLIRLNTQSVAGSLTNAEVNSSAAIASTKLATWAADRNGGGFKLTAIADPTAGTDAANKQYVDSAAQGLDVKPSVRAGTTAAITLSGTQTVDGVALSVNDRVLVKNQASGSANGIYAVQSGAWTRTTDADTSAEVTSGMFTFITEGTVNASLGWVLTTADPIVLGTTALAFAQFSSAGAITAGAGMTQSGNTLNVIAGDASVVVTADELHVGVSASGAITAAGALALALSANKGLEIVSNAVGVKLNGASLTLGASGLSVTTPSPTFVVRETPGGAVDSSNVTYTLANTPTAGSEEVFLNGVLQEPTAGMDYTISGLTITYLTAPTTGDRLRVSYRY